MKVTKISIASVQSIPYILHVHTHSYMCNCDSVGHDCVINCIKSYTVLSTQYLVHHKCQT